MCLKEADEKFSEGLEECWMEYIENYLQVAQNYKFNPVQRFQYFHNILSKDAQRFYL